VLTTDFHKTGNGSPAVLRDYPAFAPIGAGMAIRRAAAREWSRQTTEDPRRQLLDRRGQSLASGGDCDMNLTCLRAGWEVGYFPQLSLTHLIPARRLTREYLTRMNHESSRTWVQVLSVHQIVPWPKIRPWTVWPRKVKAYFRSRAWKGPVEHIRYKGACGIIEGRARIA
jgi:hypothetical protein